VSIRHQESLRVWYPLLGATSRALLLLPQPVHHLAAVRQLHDQGTPRTVPCSGRAQYCTVVYGGSGQGRCTRLEHISPSPDPAGAHSHTRNSYVPYTPHPQYSSATDLGHPFGGHEAGGLHHGQPRGRQAPDELQLHLQGTRAASFWRRRGGPPPQSSPAGTVRRIWSQRGAEREGRGGDVCIGITVKD